MNLTPLRLAAVLWLMCAIVTVVSIPAGADVIFDQALQHASNYMGTLSDVDSDNGPFGLFSQVADDFSLADGASTIDDIHWWGTSVEPTPTQPDDFYIVFYLDNAGLPGPEVASYHPGAVSRTLFDENPGYWQLFEYDWVLPAPLPLNASTPYWASIQNDLDGDVGWYWTEVPLAGQDAVNSGSGWANRYQTMAFQLTGPGGVIPEPATLSLLALGLSVAALRRLQRR